MRTTTEALICQICRRPIGDRPADIAPGPAGAIWYIHRDVTDCAKALQRRANVTDAALIAALIMATAVWGWLVLR